MLTQRKEINMKTLKTLLIIAINVAAALALAAMGAAALWAYTAYMEGKTLDACAKAANVYACHFVATPIEPALLPPPVEQ
jgi:hypothetical protein